MDREEAGMAQLDAIGGLPWYRSLNREQWRVLIASNLGWLFDGFEVYALFLTVGFALKQLLDVGQAAAISAICRLYSRLHRVRLGHRWCDRRHRRRLYWPEADDAAGDPRLFADHQAEC